MAKKKRKNLRTKKRKNQGTKKPKSQKKQKPRKSGKQTAYLGLGSNVGDREEYIEQAIFLLEKTKGVEVTKHSSNIETEAEGKEGQPLFLNAVLEIKTTLAPRQLLETCLEIETALGREREIEWGPRTMDIDILLYGDQIITDDDLQIPHPMMHERVFVLKPMTEIAPGVVHPVLEKSLSALYSEKKADLGDKYDDELPGFHEIRGGATDDYERW